MTRNPTQQPFGMDQTSSFIETATELINYTYRNYSGQGDGSGEHDESTLDGWPYFEIYGHVYWGVILSIVVLGIIGNTLLYVMMRDAKLNTRSYSVYLKVMAVTDSLLLGTQFVTETERVFCLGSHLTINETFCKASFSFRVLLMIMSPWFVVGLALDRYVCVCFPLTRETLCTRMKATVVCSCMFIVCVMFCVPILTGLELTEGRCIPSEEIRFYFIFLRLLMTSTLPCLFILVLNIIMIVTIKRSHAFRNSFTQPRTGSVYIRRNNSTRPMVLVSVMAIITLLPVSVSETVIATEDLIKTEPMVLILNQKLWPLFVLVYLLNFGQNFYILIGSSSKYRHIIKQRLLCYSVNNNTRNQVILANIPDRIHGSVIT